MPQATRGKKTTRRKKSTQRRKSTSKSAHKWPNWSLLVLGIAVGIVVVVLAQWALDRARTPGTGLNNLLAGNDQKTPARKAPPQTRTTTNKPTYDFYTILPGEETVMDERSWQASGGQHEAGVVYILQVAAYNNLADADRLKARLAINGLGSEIQKVRVKTKVYYRVRLGPYDRAIDAEDSLKRLSTIGLKALRLKLKQKN